MRATSLIAVLAAGLAVAACSSSSTPPNPDAYVGTWTFQSGTIVPNCTGITLGTVDLTGDAVTITKVDTSHIQMMISGGGVMCDVHFTVNGNSATADSGQTCALSESGYNAVLNVTTWTLALSAADIQMSMSGTASVSIVSCVPSSSGTMVRSTSDAAQSG
jgi:hypothetical protein